MKHTITDVPWTPTVADTSGTIICAWCGEQIGMHYQHADGQITCVRFDKSVSDSCAEQPK